MPSTARAACIYARISSDQDGTGLGVQRQLEDCRTLAQSLGWTVADEYVDNDVSAYNGKHRPEYQRMLADLEAGSRDGVLIYHPDRLTRRPKELEHFVDVLTAAGVRNVRFAAGGALDAGTGDGLLVLRIQSAVAAAESDTKSRRMKRKYQQKAESGAPHVSGSRAFGYELDGLTVRQAEAQVIRDLAERFLAGESLRSLCAWLTEQQIPTVRGAAQWRTPTLRLILSSGRIAGLREYQGQVIGDGQWPPIISRELRERLLARFAENVRSGRRAPRRYLLTGLLRCHRCGNRLFSASREDVRRYVCMSGPDHGGCGGTFINALPTEEWLSTAILMRLDTPDLANALAGKAGTDERTAGLYEELLADEAQIEELTALYAAKHITPREWLSARSPIVARMSVTQAALARATRSDALAGLIGNGEQLRATWAGLNLDRQAAIVRAILDHAVIGPGKRGTRTFDPDRIRPVWRL